MTQKLYTLHNKEDLIRCYPIMKELRPHLSLEEYLSIYEVAHQSNGYEIVAIEENGNILALMGYRFISDYVRGKYLYIDDLVTTEAARSKGFGAQLLKYAEELALESEVSVLRLCTGLTNEGGIKFYEHNGWSKRSYAYVKRI